MSPEQLSTQWRRSQRDFLPHRRRIAALALFDIACMSTVILYQIGLINHVPQPRLPGLDADAVNGSAQAYSIAETPDGVLGLIGGAVALGLAACGEADRRRTKPWLPLLSAVHSACTAVVAAKLTLDQPTKHKNVSLWSFAASLSIFAIAAHTLPEAISAIGNWKQ